MASASILLTSKGIIVHAMHRTTAGVYLDAEPVLRVDDASGPEIGRAVRAALAAFVDSAPHPTEWKGIGKPFLAATGFRSYRSLHSRAKLVHVDVAGEAMKLVPTRNGGPKGPDRGFTELSERALELEPHPPAAALGDAALRALDLCE